MAQKEKADVTVVSEKGQVVIPKPYERMGIGPKTRLLVYGYQDAVIMKKLEVPDMTKELEVRYRRIDKRIAKYGALTQDEVEKEIKQYRRAKAKKA